MLMKHEIGNVFSCDVIYAGYTRGVNNGCGAKTADMALTLATCHNQLFRGFPLGTHSFIIISRIKQVLTTELRPLLCIVPQRYSETSSEVCKIFLK